MFKCALGLGLGGGVLAIAGSRLCVLKEILGHQSGSNRVEWIS